MRSVGGESVEISATLDSFQGAWDITKDSDFECSKSICQNIDHGHMAPPCRTLTRARREDEFGTVRVLRSDSQPEGWGDEEAVRGNLVVARMVILCLILHNAGATFSIENPWDSFLWLLRTTSKLMSLKGVELVLLHQCAYGAISQKATGILTTAQWMKLVRSLCHEVRDHFHVPGGLAGFAWSYLEDRWVWRTSLAAEYPCGLCMAWARALFDWLGSPFGLRWLQQRSFQVRGKWKNVLVRSLASDEFEEPQPVKLSQKEFREAENQKSLGGLRNPRHAVKQSARLREVGVWLREKLEPFITDELALKLVDDINSGVPEDWILAVRRDLCDAFQVECTSEGLQEELWRAVLSKAGDPDAECLSGWIREGFPLGIKHEIENTGVFPATDTVSAAIEASRLQGRLMDDSDGSHSNYKSFDEVVEHAQRLLDQLVQEGRTEVVQTWQEVVDRFGFDAKVTKLACVVKTRETGEVKYRLVVDSRRSGINGLMSVKERVILPKITDVVSALHALARKNQGWSDVQFELFSVDFKDAFHMCRLRQDERQFVICKDSYGLYHVSKVVQFGLSPGPLLWARLASASMRIAQSVAKDWESSVHTFVDDPLLVIAGNTPLHRARSFLRYVAIWLALGLQISWKKADKGLQLHWIGFELTLHGHNNVDMTVRLTESKRQKLLDLLTQIRSSHGVFPLKLLQHAVGILGWLSSVVPISRPWLAMLWAALTQQRSPQRESTRQRKGLVFVKQVEHALRWLTALVRELDSASPGLQCTFLWRPNADTILIQTDACPVGMGGFISIGGRIVGYWHDTVSDADCSLLGATRGDPAFQSEWELLAVWVSIETFLEILKKFSAVKIFLRTDNTATIQAAMEFRAGSPVMAQLAAEVSLQLAIHQLLPIYAQHVPGILNDLADRLSRLTPDDQVPEQLRQCQRFEPVQRTMKTFHAWPEVKCAKS